MVTPQQVRSVCHKKRDQGTLPKGLEGLGGAWTGLDIDMPAGRKTRSQARRRRKAAHGRDNR